jgi:tellurite resistance protein TerC
MIWMWAGFLTPVILMLALDLGVFHREAHVVSTREALAWSAAWAALSVLFALFVYFAYASHWLDIGSTADPVDHALSSGAIAAEKYLTGYLV